MADASEISAAQTVQEKEIFKNSGTISGELRVPNHDGHGQEVDEIHEQGANETLSLATQSGKNTRNQENSVVENPKGTELSTALRDSGSVEPVRDAAIETTNLGVPAEERADSVKSVESVPLLNKKDSIQQSSWGWGSWTSVVTAIQDAATEVTGEITKTASAAAKGLVESIEAAEREADKRVTVKGTPLPHSQTLFSDGQSSGDKPAAEPVSVEESSDDKQAPQEVPPGQIVTEGKVASNLERERTQLEVLESQNEASRDTALTQGLKALDNSMESIATGAMTAWGSAWKEGLIFVHSLEQQAESLAHTIQDGHLTARAQEMAPHLLEGGKGFAEKSMKMLEYVGKETIDIIVKETGIELEEDEDPGENEPEKEEEEEEDPQEEEVTFSHCFYIYGGPEHLEELEALGSHHKLLCNRVRTKLSPSDRGPLDTTIADLLQILTLPQHKSDEDKLVIPTRESTGKAGAELDDDDEVASLRDASITKAAEMASGFSAGLGGISAAEAVRRTTERVEELKAEGVHRVAELCAASLAHLLHLGNELLAASAEKKAEQAGDGEGVEGGAAQEAADAPPSWTTDCMEKAGVVRARAESMLAGIEAVTNGFVTGVKDVVSAYDSATSSTESSASELNTDSDKVGSSIVKRGGSIQDQSSRWQSELQANSMAAKSQLQDGLHHLVFVILSTGIRV